MPNGTTQSAFNGAGSPGGDVRRIGAPRRDGGHGDRIEHRAALAVGVIGWVALGILFRVMLGVVAGLVLPLLLLGGAALYLSRRRGGALPR